MYCGGERNFFRIFLLQTSALSSRSQLLLGEEIYSNQRTAPGLPLPCMRSGKNGYFFQCWKDMAILTVEWWMSGSFTSVSTLSISWPLNFFHPLPPKSHRARSSRRLKSQGTSLLQVSIILPQQSLHLWCVRRWLGRAPVNLRSRYMQPPICIKHKMPHLRGEVCRVQSTKHFYDKHWLCCLH